MMTWASREDALELARLRKENAELRQKVQDLEGVWDAMKVFAGAMGVPYMVPRDYTGGGR